MLKLLVAGVREALPDSGIDCTEKAAELFATAGAETEIGIDNIQPERYDALIVPGGLPDVDPAYWGEPDTGCKVIDLSLDRKQMAIIKATVAQKKPIFGICRGMQLVSVFFGATMMQDIESGLAHCYDPKAPKSHEVLTVPGTFAERLYGDSITVNSAHHQALKRIPNDLRAAQIWCADPAKALQTLADAAAGNLREGSGDCIVETVYHESYPFIGTQWHPECNGVWPGNTVDAKKIVDYFLEMIKK